MSDAESEYYKRVRDMIHGLGMSEITLRDFFAAFALAGQLANPKWPNAGEHGLPASEEDRAAHWAYSFADTMLRKRGRR